MEPQQQGSPRQGATWTAIGFLMQARAALSASMPSSAGGSSAYLARLLLVLASVCRVWACHALSQSNYVTSATWRTGMLQERWGKQASHK